MDNNNIIITINREFGTGGREIAHKLGNILGIKVYDKGLLDSIAEHFNTSTEEIEKVNNGNQSWWEEFANNYRWSFGSNRAVNQHVTSKKIYLAEEKILKEIAAKESCVIVGRGGFHIFKDNPNAVKILLVADLDARVKRLCDSMDLSATEARKMIKDIDDRRERYTKKYTGVSRYDAHNYDFVLNVTNLPAHLVAVFLAQNVRMKLQKMV